MNYPNRWIIQQCLQSGTIYPCQSSRSSSLRGGCLSPVSPRFQGAWKGGKRREDAGFKARASRFWNIYDYETIPSERGQFFIERECTPSRCYRRDFCQIFPRIFTKPSLDKFAAESTTVILGRYSLRLSLITVPFFLSFEMQRDTSVPESKNCTRFLLLREISSISFFRSSKAMLEAKIFLLPFRYLQDETREEFPDQTSRWQSRLFEDRASVHSSAAFLFLEGGGREEKAEARSSEGGSKKNVHKWKSAIESPFKRYLTPPPPSLRFLHPQLESCLGRHGFHSPPT